MIIYGAGNTGRYAIFYYNREDIKYFVDTQICDRAFMQMPFRTAFSILLQTQIDKKCRLRA